MSRPWLPLLLPLLLLVRAAEAAPTVSPEAKAAAREHFARGVKLLEAGEPARAAQALEQAEALAPFAVVLYNLGVAYERMGRPVEAAAMFQRVLDDPGQLGPERVAQAKDKRAALAAQLGTVAVVTSPAGAAVRIDGAVPLEGISVSRGTHFVEASLRGYLPDRRAISVGGGQRLAVELSLEPTTSGLGQIWVRSPLPGAEVWLDGVQVGSTPMSSSLPVAAGAHRVELRRAGYFAAQQEVDVRAGAIAEVALRPTPDEAGGNTGQLVLVAEEDDLVVTVDGARHGVYREAIPLPVGPHLVKIERAGFEPAELRVDVEAGQVVERQALLVPTAERIAEREEDRSVRAIAGWITTGVGVGLLGGGVGFAIYNETKLSSLESEFTQELESGFCNSSGTTYDSARCLDLAERRDARPGLRPIGIALIGGGVAAVTAGIVVLATRPDSYADDVDEPAFARILPFATPLRGGAAFGVSGCF
ncbi:MAG: PEGA domain-containing protein [Polyangiaceae bacterium]